MPLYEFQCKACGKDSEVLVRSTDWKGTPCPHCGSTKLMKKLSVFAAGKESAGHAAVPPCGAPGRSCHDCSCGMGPN
jgi:putative FmdB family regulatory protein